MNGRGLGGLVVATLLVARAALAEPCAPWPGEPTPLPTRNDPDAMRALWAELRARDLGQAAEASEIEAPARARRFWRHALCLDPENEVARAGLLRTPIVRAVRSPVAPANAAGTSEPRSGRSVWESLADPLPLAAAPRHTALASQPGASAANQLDATLVAIQRDLQAARFEEALAGATRARTQLRAVAPAERRDREVHLEILAATAELALGRADAARASLRRALEADPDLTLDPRQTPPKVLRALEQVRTQARAGEGTS